MYEWIESKLQKTGGYGQGSSEKKTIDSAMAKELEKRYKAVEQESAINSDFEKYIMRIMASANKGKSDSAIAASSNVSDSKTRPVTIKSIIKRAATWNTQDKSEEDVKVYEMIAKTDRGDLDVNVMETYGKPRTELDSNANMVVV